MTSKIAYESLIARAEKAEAERDALAAHVEKIQQSWPYRNGVGLPQLLRKMGRALQESPETSLARRDALKQAEAWEQASDYVRSTTHAVHAHITRGISARLSSRAAELRRQAEEDP